MAEQNFPDNILYELDNLDVLRGMNSETVDLIATDPPFNTQRNRAGTAGFYVDNWKWGDTGVLPDQWAWNEVHPVWLEQVKDDNPALHAVIEAARVCHGDDIAAFLCFLSVRLLECHRVLKPEGSIYLHCDHAANGYIRMAMDAIFGRKNFRREIVWDIQVLSGFKTQADNWIRGHDTIFYYAKGRRPVFNKQSQPHRKEYLDRFNKFDANGRAYFDGRGKPRYLDEVVARGKAVGDVWSDIMSFQQNPTSTERTGSPDQKPLALYERIILASSNMGGLVLDPFAGCATTIIAARKHGRRWVGIDRRADARYHVVCRMAGVKAKDADEIRKRPDLADWLDNQLARYDAHYSTDAPVRTDRGEHAAPALEPVFTANERSVLSHAQMHGILTERFGLQCWGCDFTPPIARYLHLDHISPKTDGGSDHLDNRALLCQVRNLDKSNTMTLTQLRRKRTGEGLLMGQHPIDLAAARTWARQYLENLMRGRPQQLQLGSME